MKKVVLLLVLITFIVSSTAVYAGGVIGRVTSIDYENDTVLLSLDTNASEPSSGDLRYYLPEEASLYYNPAILDVVEYAFEHRDIYNCYISNGRHQSSGGYQIVMFAQLIPRTDSLSEEIDRLTDEVAQLRNEVARLRLFVRILGRRMRP